ncbi:MAG: hypothetical protein C0467_01690 [Planctomycetaceae bacterium]|nr:hypothetical protein [Planctomycetaceae bacterium]
MPAPIPGLAFFPGGYGLWDCSADKPLPPLPINGIMVLGHDFHSEDGYAKSFQLGGERETLPTWRNLLKLLRDVGIEPKQCFFTNLYMGLRAGSATTGVFPGAGDPRFVKHCEQFLLEQIRVQRPALILTLGVHVPPVVGRLSPELESWTLGRGLRHLDTVGPVKTNVTFEGIDRWATTIVALTHTSLRDASVRHRRYGGEEKHAAEVRMIQDAMVLGGLMAENQAKPPQSG